MSIVYVLREPTDERWYESPEAPTDSSIADCIAWHNGDSIVPTNDYDKYDAKVSALLTELHLLNDAFAQLAHSHSVCDITGLPMTRSDMEDELYQAPRSLEEKRELFCDIDKAFVSRGKSQILKDMAAKLTADGVDVVYFDCTMGGDDDE
tara:strand:- start:67 stop:516 length:450 start_codon:yes stop_codon:yes gene_type:complete